MSAHANDRIAYHNGRFIPENEVLPPFHDRGFQCGDAVFDTTRTHYVLPGISRQTMLEPAGDLGIACDEPDLDLYDAYNADEAFLTSTSLCICPVHSINGSRVGSGQVFGTITRRLIEAYVRLVDCNFVAQYRRHLD